MKSWVYLSSLDNQHIITLVPCPCRCFGSLPQLSRAPVKTLQFSWQRAKLPASVLTLQNMHDWSSSCTHASDGEETCSQRKCGGTRKLFPRWRLPTHLQNSCCQHVAFVIFFFQRGSSKIDELLPLLTLDYLPPGKLL